MSLLQEVHRKLAPEEERMDTHFAVLLYPRQIVIALHDLKVSVP
jgi:hypothetical protein